MNAEVGSGRKIARPRMNLLEIIEQLEMVPEGLRDLDMEIAKVIGWRRSTHAVKDAQTQTSKIESVWINPVSNQPGRVPRYTTNIQSAYELAKQIAPSAVGAVKWDGEQGSAWIDTQTTPVFASTPALALCAAALRNISR